MSVNEDLLAQLIAEREKTRQATHQPRLEAKPVAAAPARAVSDPRFAFAAAAFCIGLLLWPLGARYTLDGLAWIVGVVLGFLRIPLTIPAALDWPWYCVLAPIPYICSRVEWRWPLEREGKHWRLAAPDTVLIWAAIAGVDVLTTYWGLRAAPDDAWPIAREIARNGLWSALIGAILTFLPEWLLRRGWHRLWG